MEPHLHHRRCADFLSKTTSTDRQSQSPRLTVSPLVVDPSFAIRSLSDERSAIDRVLSIYGTLANRSETKERENGGT
jgi:hypothetical protein